MIVLQGLTGNSSSPESKMLACFISTFAKMANHSIYERQTALASTKLERFKLPVILSSLQLSADPLVVQIVLLSKRMEKRQCASAKKKYDFIFH